MTRFFFHILNDREIIRDYEGVDLPGAKEALEEAKDAAREILAGKVRRGEVVDGDEFAVHDDLGVLIFKLPFKSVLRFD